MCSAASGPRSLEQWSRSRVWANRRVDVRSAAGILLADLGLLQRHFRVACEKRRPE
jgi:hypothetical protein